MYNLLFLLCSIAALKILAIYVSIKAKSKNSKFKCREEQLMSKPYSLPMWLFLFYFSKKHTTRQPLKIQRPITRSKVVEIKYYAVRQKLIETLKTGKLNREEILLLRNFLQDNLNDYEQKKYKNDAHAIYSMLKAKDLSIEHLKAIEKFIAI